MNSNPLGTRPAEVTVETSSLFGKPYWRIQTATAEYWYDPAGGGLASLIDHDGKDWISFQEGPPPECYRGIPNIQTFKKGKYDGFFHPGYDTVTSRIERVAPDAIEITARNGEWACHWHFEADHATCTVLSGTEPGFAFLYEGTPGGTPFEKSKAHIILPSGKKTSFDNGPDNKTFVSAAETPSWVAFGKDGMDRVLGYHFAGQPVGIAHYQVFDALTVFGFGRENEPAIQSYPAVFTIALFERFDASAITQSFKDWSWNIKEHV